MILTVRKSTLKKKPWAMWRAAVSPQALRPQAGAITATTQWPRRCAGAATSAARTGTKNVRLAAAIEVPERRLSAADVLVTARVSTQPIQL